MAFYVDSSLCQSQDLQTYVALTLMELYCLGNSYKSTLTPIIASSDFYFCESSFFIFNNPLTSPAFSRLLIQRISSSSCIMRHLCMISNLGLCLIWAYPNYFTFVNKRHKCNTGLQGLSILALQWGQIVVNSVS